MAEVCITGSAQHFGAAHKQAYICLPGNSILRNRSDEAGPAGTGIEFVFTGKKGMATTDADICPRIMEINIFASECRLRRATCKSLMDIEP